MTAEHGKRSSQCECAGGSEFEEEERLDTGKEGTSDAQERRNDSSSSFFFASAFPHRMRITLVSVCCAWDNASEVRALLRPEVGRMLWTSQEIVFRVCVVRAKLWARNVPLA